MIELKMKQEVLLMHLREGKSQREIARKTGLDHKTVRKYIKAYESQRRDLESQNSDVDTEELIRTIVEKPKYRTGERPKRKLTKEMEERIYDLLQENEMKVRKGLRKQIKKPVDIHEVLVLEGFDISYSTVLRTVRKLMEKTKEAYIKGIYIPGDVCEFDWGEVKVIIDEKQRVLQMAVFTSAYGNYRMAYLFTKQKTECFQDSCFVFR